MRAKSFKLFCTVLAMGAVLAAAVAAIAATAVRREEGFFSPVISPDGEFVYFVKRSTAGLVWGSGIEFFTPPAHAYIWRDRFELCRVKINGGKFETVRGWPASPLEGKTVTEYRGRIFSIAQATLRFTDGQLEYELAVRIPSQPMAKTLVVQRRWDGKRQAFQERNEWREGYAQLAPGEDVLREPWEVLTVPGRENFPCAVVAHHGQSGELRTLRKTAVCDELHGKSIRWAVVEPSSRRKEIRRLREIRELRGRLIQEGLGRNQSEIAAILAADARLADLGFYPKPPQLVARRLSAAEAGKAAPLFRISEAEFQAGLFSDIERAITAPGSETEKSMGDYIRHREYATSERLNGFLKSGGRKFLVERSGQLYELSLTETRPAFR